MFPHIHHTSLWWKVSIQRQEWTSAHGWGQQCLNVQTRSIPQADILHENVSFKPSILSFRKGFQPKHLLAVKRKWKAFCQFTAFGIKGKKKKTAVSLCIVLVPWLLEGVTMLSSQREKETKAMKLCDCLLLPCHFVRSYGYELKQQLLKLLPHSPILFQPAPLFLVIKSLKGIWLTS